MFFENIINDWLNNFLKRRKLKMTSNFGESSCGGFDHDSILI